jgi:hypothetical protein
VGETDSRFGQETRGRKERKKEKKGWQDRMRMSLPAAGCRRAGGWIGNQGIDSIRYSTLTDQTRPEQTRQDQNRPTHQPTNQPPATNWGTIVVDPKTVHAAIPTDTIMEKEQEKKKNNK